MPRCPPAPVRIPPRRHGKPLDLKHKKPEGIATLHDEISRYGVKWPDLKPLVEWLPTSYQFKKGHRLHIALAGADNDHFQNLDGPAPTWEVMHTPDRPSHIELPIVR